MLCEKCGKNEANVYIKNVINGETTELHLCSDCAAAQGLLKETNPFAGMSDFFQDFGNAFQGFFPEFLNPAPGRRALGAAKKCPLCGATAQDIIRTGRAGCANCYSEFESLLEPAIRRIHGDVTHSGAVPGSAGAEVNRRRRLSELKHELKAAVKNEAYEDAARLRDEIRALEQGGEAHA